MTIAKASLLFAAGAILGSGAVLAVVLPLRFSGQGATFLDAVLQLGFITGALAAAAALAFGAGLWARGTSSGAVRSLASGAVISASVQGLSCFIDPSSPNANGYQLLLFIALISASLVIGMRSRQDLPAVKSRR